MAAPWPQPRLGLVRLLKLQLQVLAFQDGKPLFPEIILTRFPEGTTEHAAIDEKFKQFKAKFPDQPVQKVAGGAPPRSGGLCDFNVDGGKRPVDPHRQLALLAVKDADFQVQRRQGAKHTVVDFFVL